MARRSPRARGQTTGADASVPDPATPRKTRQPKAATPAPSLFAAEAPSIRPNWSPDARAVVFNGDALDGLAAVPNDAIQLIVTSPPYNLGKEYELETELQGYLAALDPIVSELVRVLSPTGSICWQVGNYIAHGEVFPLDILFYPHFKRHGLQLRNRIVWHFDHGLHCTHRFSGRYETLLWFTKTDDYAFNLDPVRIPSKYPGKTHYKPGDKYGTPSGNPLGKNPSDYWKVIERDWREGVWEIPNVKANHPEKTAHPCQFPIELVERCVLALSDSHDWVLDPFGGVGSSLVAALMHGRRGFGCERDMAYCAEMHSRIAQLYDGSLPYRTLGKPVHQPSGREKVTQVPLAWQTNKEQA